MDPRKAECYGYYLYGAGYFARDDNTLGIVSGQESQEHFCLRCPRMADCERRQQARVREQAPEATERYARALQAAHRRGMSPLLASVALAQHDQNPFFTDAQENFKRGHADRGASAGTLVHIRDRT